MKKIEERLVLTDAQMITKVEKIVRFLKLVYPDTTIMTGYKEGTIEIRFLRRRNDRETTGERSFNTWVFDEESIGYLLEKMNKLNGVTVCTYYSGYSFNRETKNGKKINQITNDTALFTYILPMDFDGINETEFLKQKQRLLDLGIETLDVYSGHGYQSLILLTTKNYDKKLYANFTTLLLEKGFPVDEKITDAARVLRMPYTHNCKSFQIGDKYYNPINPEGIETYVYSETTNRYDVDWVFEQISGLESVKKEKEDLQQLPDLKDFLRGFDLVESTYVLPEPEEVKKEVTETATTKITGTAKMKKTKEVPLESTKTEEKLNLEIKSTKEYVELYKHLNYERLPVAVQNILMGTPKSGVGNDSLLFLIPLLRNHLGLSLKEQIETLQVWGEHCTPEWTKQEIKSEVSRLNKYNFSARYGAYTKEMEETFGELIFESWGNDDEINIPNEIFNRIGNIPDGSIKVILGLLLLEHDEGGKNFTMDLICEKVNIAERTFKKHISFLKKENIVGRRKMNRTKGEKYEYYINPYLESLKGFTGVKTALIELMLLKGMNDGQIILYLYLKRMIGERKENVWASQKYLSEKIGKSQNRISEMTDELHDKKWIRKETTKIGRVKHSTYTLLR